MILRCLIVSPLSFLNWFNLRTMASFFFYFLGRGVKKFPRVFASKMRSYLIFLGVTKGSCVFYSSKVRRFGTCSCAFLYLGSRTSTPMILNYIR